MLAFQDCYVSEPSYDSILHYDGMMTVVLLELWLGVVSAILLLIIEVSY